MQPKYGVAVMSYNRPLYLEQSLESIYNQIGPPEGYDVHLFNDGPHDENVEHCHRAFEKNFNKENMHTSDKNLSVCFNYKRAEEYMFDRYDRVIFIADDFISSPVYFEWLHIMAERFKDNKSIGAINASAVLTKEMEIEWQEENKGKLFLGNYANALMFKEGYLKWKPYMEPYYAVVAESIAKLEARFSIGNKYHANSAAITNIHDEYGCKPQVSSQDGMKEVAFVKAGLVKIRGGIQYCKDIGMTGIHHNVQIYKTRGLHKVVDPKLFPGHDLYTDIKGDPEDIERLRKEYSDAILK